MYDIEIDYGTGNSFHSERIRDERIGIVVSDIETATKNLNRIKKHYKQYEDNPNFGKKYSLKLLTDDGERTIIPFWIGYFETLYAARVVTDLPSFETDYYY